MHDDYGHWLEVIAGALVGLGGWLWRLGRREQEHEDRIKRLEDIAAHEQEKRSERDARMFARLEEMGRVQAEHGVRIAHIAETCAETRQAVLDGIAARVPGGRRSYDPPGVAE